MTDDAKNLLRECLQYLYESAPAEVYDRITAHLAAPAPEPVAVTDDDGGVWFYGTAGAKCPLKPGTKLFTAPPSLLAENARLREALRYDIEFGGEIGAGLRPFTDKVYVTVESGDPGGDDGEFQEYMRQCLADWFDGATVSAALREPK